MSLILALLTIISAALTDIAAPSPRQASSVLLAFEPADREVYILGPGDILEVIVEGGATPAALASGLFPQAFCTVTTDGVLSISGLGQVSVGGLTIVEAELELARLTRSYYPGIRIGIALSIPRLVRVRASGAVIAPGIYPMYALQSVADLLDACGAAAACSRTGWIFSGADSTRFDLRIDPDTHLPSSDPLLVGGSTVLFSSCENPVYVIRPSIDSLTGSPSLSTVLAWEVDGPTSLQAFLEMTGGAGADFDPGRSALLRDGAFIPVWSDSGFVFMTVQPGDTLFLADARSTVTVSGAVALPAAVVWIAGLRTLDYVHLAGGPLVDANVGGLRLMRGGETIAAGRGARNLEPAPGDIVEVPFTWTSRHTGTFAILGTIVSAVAIIISLGQ